MGVALGWVAFALAGVASTPSAELAKAQIIYNVQMVETEGVGWREGVFTRLKPVTRQGSATVWTVPRDAAKQLLDEFSRCPNAKILAAPKVTAVSGAPAAVQFRHNRSLVTQIAWNGQETAAQAAPEHVRAGWHTTMVGRKLDQGVLVQVVFEDTVIRAVHHVKVDRSTEHTCTAAAISQQQVHTDSEKATGLTAIANAILGTEPRANDQTSINTVQMGIQQGLQTKREPKGKRRIVDNMTFDGSTTHFPTAARDMCAESQACCKSGESAGKADDIQNVVLDVPEIDTQEVLGEWLVPHGEVLLVSFGAHTVADEDGMAVVKERLAMIEADLAAGASSVIGPNALPSAPVRVFAPQVTDPAPPPPVMASPFPDKIPIMPVTPSPVVSVPAPLPQIPVPTPIMPSRSIPQGVRADGTPADLPPLPDDETELDSSSSESSEPLASPQTKKIPQPKAKPTTDSGANKAEFTLPKAASMFLPSLFMPSPSSGFQFLMPIKPLSLKLPFGQKLEVEVIGRVVADSEVR